MLIVDSQVHIWDSGTPPPHHRQQPFSAKDLLAEMILAGVDRAVLVPPGWDPAGNDPSLRAAKDHPDRFAIMGRLDTLSPDASTKLARWRAQPGMLGVRLAFNNAVTRSLLIDRSIDWLWQAAADLDLPIMMLAPGLLPTIADIAHRYPSLRIVVDHLAIPRGARGEAAFEHMPELLAISRYPNVAVKAAGLPSYALNDDFPYLTLQEPLRQTIEAFGSDRVFWGTDLSRMRVPYSECVTMMTEGMPWLKEIDLRQIMGLGLVRWLDWR